MTTFLARVRKVVVRRATSVAALLALTMARLLTDGGLKPAIADELYLLAVTALVVAWCLRVLVQSETVERPGTARSRRPAPPERPERLVRVEDNVKWWVQSAYLRHTALRPALRGLAVDRLRRAGIDIDRDPRAAQLLGETGWSLVRQGVEPPADDGAVGLTPAQALDLARSLKALGRPDFTHPAHTGGQH